MGMDDVLLGIVLRRMADIPLPEQSADLLLAAFEGDESLSAQLGGQAQPRSKALDVTAPPTPAGAYLQSLTVSGFRGIGAAATLKVMPRPGLTLAVGRNGSGKSSFAEAIEVLLTGNLRRWEKLPAVWNRAGAACTAQTRRGSQQSSSSKVRAWPRRNGPGRRAQTSPGHR
jgi:hypothetical protein